MVIDNSYNNFKLCILSCMIFFLQGCFGVYGLILFIYYITHLETDPLTKRVRFVIFNREQEKALGQLIFEFVSKYNLYVSEDVLNLCCMTVFCFHLACKCFERKCGITN